MAAETTTTGPERTTTTARSPAAELPESACDLLTEEELSEAVGSPVGEPGGGTACTFQDPGAGTTVALSVLPWADVSAGPSTLEQVEGSDVRYTLSTPGATTSLDVLRFGDTGVSLSVFVPGEGNPSDAATERVVEALIAKYGG